MIIDPKNGSSLSHAPENLLIELAGTGVPFLCPTLRNYVNEAKPRVHFQVVLTERCESISVDLPTEVAYELAEKMAGECYAWKAKALEQHENEDFSFLVMYRFVGPVRIAKKGIVQQLLEFGLEKEGNFAMRIARSEPEELDYTNFMHLTLPDYELGNLARQFKFVAQITEE